MFHRRTTANCILCKEKSTIGGPRPKVDCLVRTYLEPAENGVNVCLTFLLPCGEDVLVTLARFLLFVVKILEGKVLVQMLHGFGPDRVEPHAGAEPRIAKRSQRLVQCNVVLHKFLCGFLAEVLELLNGAIDETFVRATSTESLNALVHQLIIVESIGVQFERGVRINFLGVRIVRKETATPTPKSPIRAA